MEVGNAYINRPITGAIVRRQPFGGWKNSVVGPGAKAGGPNYVMQLCRWRETALPDELESETDPSMAEELGKIVPGATERIRRAAGSYAKWWGEEFSREHDPSQVHGESNVFRYRGRGMIVVRCDGMRDEDLALVLLAARTCRARLQCSASEDRPTVAALARAAGFSLWIEDDEQLGARLARGVSRIGTIA